MSVEEFRSAAHELVDWMADFLSTIEERPVRAQVEPGEVIARLPDAPPVEGEAFAAIMEDFREILVPGITHWQHPSFFAYFPANSSYPSILAEMLMATLGVQGMSWQTSPSATELEQQVMRWLRDMIGLPASFEGVIQDTASTGTLVALITARERATGYRINEEGFARAGRLTVYASSQTHSSIEKGVKIAGYGRENLRLVDVDGNYAMRPEALRAAILADREAGCVPTCVVVTIGTTGSTAVDPLKEIVEIAREFGLWVHVDAALAGTAMVLPEMRRLQEGIEGIDSYVFNPHKWMFTNFDCTAYFVRDRDALLRAFEIHPEYLRTKEGDRVNNYRDWGIQLGRRFRSLKLWFVIRSYGVAGLQRVIREHLALAQWLREQVEAAPDFELLAPVPLNTLCLRYRPAGGTAPGSGEEELNALNAEIMERANATGRAYFTHTKLDGRYVIRFVIGQTYTERRHVEAGWKLLVETARGTARGT
ncbi:MAG: aspartate aminotransferase family protein [Spirochaetaceae bacterium]|nr:MAG: aspartate aminotransferase family protein [Spirochaetaceae bacterium]